MQNETSEQADQPSQSAVEPAPSADDTADATSTQAPTPEGANAVGDDDATHAGSDRGSRTGSDQEPAALAADTAGAEPEPQATAAPTPGAEPEPAEEEPTETPTEEPSPTPVATTAPLATAVPAPLATAAPTPVPTVSPLPPQTQDPDQAFTAPAPTGPVPSDEIVVQGPDVDESQRVVISDSGAAACALTESAIDFIDVGNLTRTGAVLLEASQIAAQASEPEIAGVATQLAAAGADEAAAIAAIIATLNACAIHGYQV